MRPAIAVVLDRYGGWHERFAAALLTEQSKDAWFDFEVADFDAHDWIDTAKRFDAVLWRSSVMGPVAASHFKDKIYFLEAFCNKLVFPNFKTVWHFESKVAQSYVLAEAGVATPRTFVSFDYHDAAAQLRQWRLPLVIKASHGAASTNVFLVEREERAQSYVQQTFAHQLSHEATLANGGRLHAALRGLRQPWLRRKIADRILGAERFRPVYWQEFIPDNDADLRITVIGGQYAIAFWRRNRRGDFRASGSGSIDYERAVPEEAVKICVELSRRMGFDSMAYDVLRKDEQHVIVEMSYAYIADAVANAKGVFERRADGSLSFSAGGRWPQDLWAISLLDKLRARRER